MQYVAAAALASLSGNAPSNPKITQLRIQFLLSSRPLESLSIRLKSMPSLRLLALEKLMTWSAKDSPKYLLVLLPVDLPPPLPLPRRKRRKSNPRRKNSPRRKKKPLLPLKKKTSPLTSSVDSFKPLISHPFVCTGQLNQRIYKKEFFWVL